MQPSRDLRLLVLGLYHDWTNKGDPWTPLLLDHPDVLVIGTDPNEWWRGGRKAAAVRRQQTAEMPNFRREPPDRSGIGQISPGELFPTEHGDAGWIADPPAVTMEDGSQFQVR